MKIPYSAHLLTFYIQPKPFTSQKKTRFAILGCLQKTTTSPAERTRQRQWVLDPGSSLRIKVAMLSGSSLRLESSCWPLTSTTWLLAHWGQFKYVPDSSGYDCAERKYPVTSEFSEIGFCAVEGVGQWRVTWWRSCWRRHLEAINGRWCWWSSATAQQSDRQGEEKQNPAKLQVFRCAPVSTQPHGRRPCSYIDNSLTVPHFQLLFQTGRPCSHYVSDTGLWDGY